MQKKDVKGIIILIIFCLCVIFVSKSYKDSTETPLSFEIEGVAVGHLKPEAMTYKNAEFNGIRKSDWLPWLKKRDTTIDGTFSVDDGQVSWDLWWIEGFRWDTWIDNHTSASIDPRLGIIAFYFKEGDGFDKTHLNQLEKNADSLWVFSSDGRATAAVIAEEIRQNIIRKCRTHNGVLQYRRWNKTEERWMDLDWIDVRGGASVLSH